MFSDYWIRTSYRHAYSKYVLAVFSMLALFTKKSIETIKKFLRNPYEWKNNCTCLELTQQTPNKITIYVNFLLFETGVWLTSTRTSILVINSVTGAHLLWAAPWNGRENATWGGITYYAIATSFTLLSNFIT